VADPTSLDKTPTQNMSLNKPAGGTYGEKAEVDRLKKELPTSGGPMGPGGPQQAPPQPRPRAARPVPASIAPPTPAGPTGVPDALMHPGSRPMSTGQPDGPAQPAVANISQARIALLDSLHSSQEVSPETREWAGIMLEMMLDASRS